MLHRPGTLETIPASKLSEYRVTGGANGDLPTESFYVDVNDQGAGLTQKGNSGLLSGRTRHQMSVHHRDVLSKQPTT